MLLPFRSSGQSQVNMLGSLAYKFPNLPFSTAFLTSQHWEIAHGLQWEDQKHSLPSGGPCKSKQVLSTTHDEMFLVGRVKEFVIGTAASSHLAHCSWHATFLTISKQQNMSTRQKKQMHSITRIILIALNGLMGSVLVLMCVCERLQMPVWRQDLNWWIGLGCIYLEFTKETHTSALSSFAALMKPTRAHLISFFCPPIYSSVERKTHCFFSPLG